jgi:hypothetical protein
MAELKHNFSKAIMNKDMDERVVPNGQYRDALNIEIATSEGANVGAAQTLLGNTKQDTMLNTTGNAYYGIPDTATVVASIASPERDKIYYFVSGGDSNISSSALAVRKDYILEYDVTRQTSRYVFVDIYSVSVTNNTYNAMDTSVMPDNFAGTNLYIDQPVGTVSSTTLNTTGVRTGMRVTFDDGTYSQDLDSNVYVNQITSVHSTLSAGEPLGWAIKLNKSITINPSTNVTFHGNRVLNFNKNTLITGINILDDFIFWTDNNSEPKKINIPRSIAGTGGTEFLSGAGITSYSSIDTSNVHDIFKGDTDYFHTRLVKEIPTLVSGVSNYEIVTFPDNKRAVWVDESHVTVIRKAPTQPLELKMSRSAESRQSWSGEFNNIPTNTLTHSSTTLNLGPNSVEVGDSVDATFFQQVDFRLGDILVLVESASGLPESSFVEYTVRAEVTASNVDNSSNLATTGFTLKILSLGQGIDNTSQKWLCRLFDKEPLFEFKFPRFSYRYKYIDGEYSPFAPFSQVAFLPSEYEYHPKKGYNLGMVNSLRSLSLTYYHYDEFSMPDDVVEIDLLYKESNNPTVYTVKTIKEADEDPLWPLAVTGEGYRRGEFKVTTDMIHAVVPSNQLLRPYDNVPKKALSQEISANRLIYGNYVQNLTVLKDPVILVSLDKEYGKDFGFGLPSVKTQRTYQIGVVYSDEYGRETPVLTSKNATITVPKDAVTSRNRLSVKLGKQTEVPSWAKYYSFYVKETSIEYHTMAMDRWYDAADGNIWISFPSSDRNKIDEETFLELKKAHASDTIITEPARYKVLAIENEVPESVKVVRTDLGQLFDTGASVVGNSVNGYPLQDTTFITIQQSAFENTYGDLATSTPDSLFLKLYSPWTESFEYKVTRISVSGTAYKLKIEGKFGPDAAFVSANDTYAGRIAGLSLRLFSAQPEPKPEFEGRFFVKIFRDELLVNSLSQPGEVELIVDATFGLRYINNNGYLNGSYGSEVPTGAIMRPYGSSAAEVNADTTNNANDGSVLGIHPTEYNYEYWEDLAGDEYVFPNEDQYLWGGSSGESFGLSKDDLRKPSKALGDTASARGFWEAINNNTDDFFIDAATAFSLTGKNDDRPGNYFNHIYETPHNGRYYSGQNTSTGEINPGGTSSGGMGGNEAFAHQDPLSPPAPDGSYPHEPGSMQNDKGMPSRGIWGSGEFMDIAWSGFSPAYTGGGVGRTSFPNQLKNCEGEVRQTAANFIRRLVTPGTKFRFQRDPDSTLYTVKDFANYEYGYNNTNYWMPYADKFTGAYGIRNTNYGDDADQYRGYQLRQRWTIAVEPPIGSGDSGYSPTKGTDPQVIKTETDPDFRRAVKHDASDKDVIEIMVDFISSTPGKSQFTENPGIWETVPKESVDIDIYYQASGLIPLLLTEETIEEYVPVGSTFDIANSSGETSSHTVTGILENTYGMGELDEPAHITFSPGGAIGYDLGIGDEIKFTKRKNYSFTARVEQALSGTGASGGQLRIRGGKTTFDDENGRMQNQTHILSWNNCYTFFNGVESDRMRDDFNAPQLDNGVKASSVIAEQSLEERREHGLIWSGIYNSSSGINDTNQFIAAEKITKDLNPVYGSIQKLLNRNTRLIMFCEDNVLRAVTNRDALYNADGNPQLVASNAVVGDTQPYEGNYGVAKNPESVASTPKHVYFSDVARGAVCALSGEGITAISSNGMSDYFADTLDSAVYKALGTYDIRKDEYNLSIYKKQDPFFQIKDDESVTVSYSGLSRGWSSFKSFLPEHGVGINNNYYTFKSGHLWKHNTNEVRNNFYNEDFNSSITLLFNDSPTAVKSFGAINYEGSQARISNFDTELVSAFNNDYSSNAGLADVESFTDGEYFNLGGVGTDSTMVNGWYVESITTNLQSCGSIEFKDKEGKYFGQISGQDTSLSNLDEKEFSVQGLGMASMTHSGSAETHPEDVTIIVNNNTDITYTGNNSGLTVAWDSVAD